MRPPSRWCAQEQSWDQLVFLLQIRPEKIKSFNISVASAVPLVTIALDELSVVSYFFRNADFTIFLIILPFSLKNVICSWLENGNKRARISRMFTSFSLCMENHARAVSWHLYVRMLSFASDQVPTQIGLNKRGFSSLSNSRFSGKLGFRVDWFRA